MYIRFTNLSKKALSKTNSVEYWYGPVCNSNKHQYQLCRISIVVKRSYLTRTGPPMYFYRKLFFRLMTKEKEITDLEANSKQVPT
jgi:hypothetical protein